MKLEKALTLYLGGLGQSVITSYDFGLVLLQLYVTKKFNGDVINNITKDFPGLSEVKRYQSKLKNNGILSPIKGFPEDKLFSILGKSDATASEITCAADPFSYVSHLSAMDYHGITGHLPKSLFISTFPQTLWAEKAKEKMYKDFGKFIDPLLDTIELPKLTKPRLDKVKGTTINKYQSKSIGSYIVASDQRIRVSSIGRTFLDMVREPSLCGGIRHVMESYSDNAEGYKRLITDEIDRHGTSIEKARAGYILEEHCNVNDPIIDEWAKHVTRGGSRKLDPQEAFCSEFSERWCISLNY